MKQWECPNCWTINYCPDLVADKTWYGYQGAHVGCNECDRDYIVGHDVCLQDEQPEGGAE
jgi:hypothetical protein